MQGEISSLLALLIQTAGVVLMAALTAFLTRTVDRRYLRTWATAWGCLAAALVALSLTFRWPSLVPFVQPVYFGGEYAFGLLLAAGCRERSTGVGVRRKDAWWALPAVGLALFLPHAAPDLSRRFVVQAAIMAVLFALAFWQLERGRHGRTAPAGVRVMSVALVLLTIEFAQYVPILGYAILVHATVPGYVVYMPLYDLLFEVLLGFGTVILAMEEANAELREAHDRMEALARVDPLTEALNRHAFYSMVEPGREGGVREGSVAVVDIDGLKALNDRLGHAAGDVAIRAVAKAIRSVVRADDLAFRWGGDEFLVVLVGLPEEEARRRLGALDEPLRSTVLPGASAPLPVSVSWGVAGFDAARPLQRAIEAADRAMYAGKEAKRG